MAFSIVDFPKESACRIFSSLQEEELALLGMSCKTFWQYVEKAPYWDSSLKEKIIFPVQSSAKGQLAKLYSRYCQYFEKQFPPSSKENTVFTRKVNVDRLIQKIAYLSLISIFENAARSCPEILPLLIHIRSRPETWKLFSLTLALKHKPSHASFYISLGAKPDEMALQMAIQHSPDHVSLLLEKDALPTKAVLDCAVQYSPHLIPLLLAKEAKPDAATLCNTARFCPEYIPNILQRLHELHTPQQAIDKALSSGAEMRWLDLLLFI